MLSLSVFLEHFIPVLFTLVVYSLLILLQLTLSWARGTQGAPSHNQQNSNPAENTMNRYSLRGGPRGHPRSAQRERLVQGDEDIYADIKRIESFSSSRLDQYQSPLFSLLPGEVRDLIYEYALSDYEDLSRPYDLETCYRRPEYMGPRRTDTALLRTCQAIYEVAWYMPWTSAQHTVFMTANDRKPTKTTEVEQLALVSRLIERLHPDIPMRRKQIKSVQIFSQLYILEPGHALNELLSVPHFHPVHITLTLRHTDIWWWEQDHPIHIKTPWVRLARFPPSTARITIEVESLERRKPQVDYVAACAKSEWFFTRSDQVHLVCTNPHTEVRWMGSSTWGDRRWVRDEDDREPGVLHYYIAALTFTPADPQVDCEGYELRNSSHYHLSHNVQVPHDVAAKTQIAGSQWASVSTQDMREAGASSDLSASETVRMVQQSAIERRQGIRDIPLLRHIPRRRNR